ncbi:uncharacterized protein LOC123547427 [Mercenaria mercenaria]|uniref:uncharacterized protein LOC123547427 n=1 Tax=Mercenaria mercenaria TaxID=6596 RepID=UPI00234F7CF2|nr:uncharacterized protein LOC123547427 [Mercenaria mercenaria]XP_045190466.2 uncharacterized protein LOC123547427 [Mercenaria mercenaria]
MAADKKGNLNIIGDNDDSKETKPTVPEEEKDREIVLDGDDARIIKHFFNNDLIEIGYKGRVTKEPQTDGPTKRLIIKYNVKKAEFVETHVDGLKSKVRELAEKEVLIPADKKSGLADFYREFEDNPDVLVLPDIASDKVRIVGLHQDKVDKAAHKLKLKTGVITTTSGRFNRQVSDPDGSSSSYASIVANGKSERPYSNIDPLLKKNSSYGNSTKGYSSKSTNFNTSGSSTWRGSSSYRASSLEKFEFETTLEGGLVLKVYKASITRLRVDAIVNAANDTMMHGGGVARVISEAAGYDLDKESRDYVDRRGQVKVSENIVTTAGKLPYRGVIHAVGPIWHDYGNKTDCLQDLYNCVFKILTRCEQRKFRTVGMSAISAGIFAVPKELCADMYVKAAVDFSEKLSIGEYACPEELHIIDVDESILHLVKASVEKWQRSPSSIKLDVTLEKYLKDNPHVISYPGSSNNSGNRHRGRRSRGHGTNQGGDSGSYGKSNESSDDGMKVDSKFSLNCTLKKTDRETFHWGGVAQVYDFDSQIKVKVFKGEIDKAKNMDAVVCGTDKSLQARGYIMEALKKAGGSRFKNSMQRMVDKYKFSVKTLDVFKCEAGDLGVDHVMFIVMERVVYANEGEIMKYKAAVKKILEKARELNLKQLVIPMFGTGVIQSNKNNLRKCCVALLKGIDSFLEDRGNKAKVTDIHLVNNSPDVCEMLEEVFDTGAGVQQGASGGSQGGGSRFSSGDDERRTGNDFNQSKRESSSRTYNAAGLVKGSNSYRETGQSGSNPKSDFSRSQDGGEEEVHSGGERSSGLGGGQNVNPRKNSRRDRAPSPQNASAQADGESDHENTNAPPPKPPPPKTGNQAGNLNIIED